MDHVRRRRNADDSPAEAEMTMADLQQIDRSIGHSDIQLTSITTRRTQRDSSDFRTSVVLDVSRVQLPTTAALPVFTSGNRTIHQRQPIRHVYHAECLETAGEKQKIRMSDPCYSHLLLILLNYSYYEVLRYESVHLSHSYYFKNAMIIRSTTNTASPLSLSSPILY